MVIRGRTINMNTDYRIEAISVLLNDDCILQRYFPLIPYKDDMVKNLKKIGCCTKSDCMKLSDQELLDIGLADVETVKLFRNFLCLYDAKPTKFKEISTVCESAGEEKSFKELYHLPGVKSTRARLYYKAGFGSLDKIAGSSVQEIVEKIECVMKTEKLDLKVPLAKKIRTHIAVARAFTDKEFD